MTSVSQSDNQSVLPKLANNIALVTGDGRGIGRAVAIALGRRGASVVVNYVSNREAAAETVKAVEAAGGKALALQGKLGSEASVAALFEAALDAFGRLDILVINAAVARFAPIGTVSEAEFDATVAVNMRALFFCLQQAAKHMADGGRIVAISAAMTTVGRPNTLLYAGTKAAIEVFARCGEEAGPARHHRQHGAAGCHRDRALSRALERGLTCRGGEALALRAHRQTR